MDNILLPFQQLHKMPLVVDQAACYFFAGIIGIGFLEDIPDIRSSDPFSSKGPIGELIQHN